MAEPIRPSASRFAAHLFAFTLAVCLVGLAAAPVSAFVTLDTSAPADTSKQAPPDSASKADTSRAGSKPPAAVPGNPAVAAPAPVPDTAPPKPAPPRVQAKPHYRTVLFLSADNMLVYSQLGVLKALEEFKLDVDLVVAESKSVLVGAAWCMGYPMVRVEERLQAHPLSEFLVPHKEHGSIESRFTPYGPDPLQVELPLGLQSLQNPVLDWSGTPSLEADEYLHLSWMVAKLTHDAPGGPVEDIKEAPRPLAVQVADLQDERAKILFEGNLQSLLKGGLLPKDALRLRKRLWPHASGALISGHAFLSDALPFTYDRLITLEPSHNLKPPPLERSADPWQDSLDQRLKSRSPGSRETSGPGSLRIALRPDAGFEASSRDPKPWIEMGYASALRSMDALLATLGKREPLPPPAAGLPPPLGLNRLTVNPLGAGGRQLLQDLVRQSVEETDDTTGDEAISDLIHSGYYSDLDVEWVSGQTGEYPGLVFDAMEKSRLLFKAGANVANQGEDLPDRGPEAYSGLAWSEPFYVPFRAEAAGLLGGHRPGYSLMGMIAPIHPVHLELGVSQKEWRIFYPFAPSTAPKDLDPWSVRVERRVRELFFRVFPYANLRLGTAIQWHDMPSFTRYVVDTVGGEEEQDSRFEEEDTVWTGFESTDFQQTAMIGLGGKGPSGLYRHSLWLRYRNLNRVNLFGPVKFASSSLESRLRVSFGPFRFLDQYFWSDQETRDAGPFEFMEAGEVAAWSFQDEYFLPALRGTHFQNVQAEFAPTFRKAGLRLMAGGFRLYGQPLLPGLGIDFTRIYWEAQVSYATPAGPIRAGLAGLEGESPFYFIRFGADLDLETDGPEN